MLFMYYPLNQVKLIRYEFLEDMLGQRKVKMYILVLRRVHTVMHQKEKVKIRNHIINTSKPELRSKFEQIHYFVITTGVVFNL